MKQTEEELEKLELMSSYQVMELVSSYKQLIQNIDNKTLYHQSIQKQKIIDYPLN